MYQFDHSLHQLFAVLIQVLHYCHSFVLLSKVNDKVDELTMNQTKQESKEQRIMLLAQV
jgi:hypothetical protein